VKLSRPVLVNGILGGVIVLALVGGGLWLWHPWSAAASGATTGTQLTSTVQQGSVSQTVTASGAVSPAREVTASFAVSGTVASVDVAVGQTVTAGQQLGTIDATDLKTTASEDYTAWVHAKQDLAAAQSSATASSGPGGGAQSSTQNSTSTINSAEDAVTKAYDAYQQAETAVGQATLTAPIAGLVIAVNGTVGGSSSGASASASNSSATQSGSGTGANSSASSSSGSGFATIADTSAYIVTANIAEADISDVAVGQAASVTFPALTGTTATAKVTAISPTATSSNSVVTYATTITLDKLPDKVRLGQTAQVAITIAASKDDALYVPAAAITTANGTSTVKVVKNGKTSTVDVTTGVVGDQGTEITKGLTAGETVVIGTVSPSTTGTIGTSGTGITGTRGGFGGAGGAGGFSGGGFGGGTGGLRSGAGGN